MSASPEVVFGLLSGIILNPIVILIKHFVLPKNVEGEVTSSLVFIISAILGISIAFFINSQQPVGMPILDVIFLGLGITATSGVTNVVAGKPITNKIVTK